MEMRVCVTGAGGFVASWLVKLLLSKGYYVHGTVRDPSDEKNAHLKRLDKATENLQLFKADLQNFEAIAAAIDGCDGVFHVASPVNLQCSNPEEELIKPAVDGTLNVLKASAEAKVKRVVLVSSVASVMLNPHWPEGKPMDESCWSDEDTCRKTQFWYGLSKTIAEKEAFDYAEKHGVCIVSLCPGTVLGPLLQPTINSSSLFLIKVLQGNFDSFWNFQSWPFVDVRDTAEALLLLYEMLDASGRYICSDNPIQVTNLIELLKDLYPGYKSPTKLPTLDSLTVVTSEKLKKIGWKCRELKETISDTALSLEEAGIFKVDTISK